VGIEIVVPGIILWDIYCFIAIFSVESLDLCDKKTVITIMYVISIQYSCRLCQLYYVIIV